jgi:hypothetical protein
MGRNLGFLFCAAVFVLPTPAAAQDFLSIFKTPSGNILCQVIESEDYTETQLNCDVLDFSNTPPPPPDDCDWPEDWGHSFALTANEGSAFRLCTHDSFNEPGISVLAYGQVWEYGDLFRCTSARQGLTCENQFGNGFFLSRADQQLY